VNEVKESSECKFIQDLPAVESSEHKPVESELQLQEEKVQKDG
jgi:hypothetical protein